MAVQAVKLVVECFEEIFAVITFIIYEGESQNGHCRLGGKHV